MSNVIKFCDFQKKIPKNLNEITILGIVAL